VGDKLMDVVGRLGDGSRISWKRSGVTSSGFVYLFGSQWSGVNSDRRPRPPERLPAAWSEVDEGQGALLMTGIEKGTRPTGG
jgi:hypothetical protein